MLDWMSTPEKITVGTLAAAKRAGRKFSVLTCYDAAFARLMAASGVEVLLVGDTAGEVVLGLSSTRDVPAEFLLGITAAVRRAAPGAFVMADLPWFYRQEDVTGTVAGCGRFVRETQADAVKVEVTGKDAALVSAIRASGIPVVAHLGLLPQWITGREGYRAFGRDAKEAAQLIEDAARLEAAGASLLLLEAVASEVAGEITARASVPVIGCVSGPRCDGTVVVLHDMLGLGGGHRPRAVKQYLDLSAVLSKAFRDYVDDIHAGRFPVEADAIHMRPGELEKLSAPAGGR
ncbi:MAG: 3-methyl-2-oxobutanoate hydroxymethyltransferase [Phycisphaerae bacterium]|nr:3-methyl-2-oxobutanoate hydroxymethyltransferase [Phycisphaerae bacterium]